MYKNFSAVVDRTFFVLRIARAGSGLTDDSVELAHVLGRASSGLHHASPAPDHSGDWWWGLPGL